MTKRKTSTITTSLKAKSRRRREALVEQQAARRSTAPPRNDLTPNLQLVRRPVSSLRSTARRLRKAERAHLDSLKRAIASPARSEPAIRSWRKLAIAVAAGAGLLLVTYLIGRH
jgi:hypothetical protein